MRVAAILTSDYLPYHGKTRNCVRLFAICLSFCLIGCSSSPQAVSPSNAVSPSSNHSADRNPAVVASRNSQAQVLPIEAKATIGADEILLEVARTPEQQSLGLMHRPSLDKNRGMLFLFNPPRPVGFWMKNVQIHLDMIFLQEEKIVAIANNVPPCKADPCPTYGTPQAIDRVIELRGGRAAELGLKRGDRVRIQFLRDRTTAH